MVDVALLTMALSFLRLADLVVVAARLKFGAVPFFDLIRQTCDPGAITG